MKKICVTALCLLIVVPVFGKGKDVFSHIPYKSAAWESKVTNDSGSGKETTTQKVWYKNNKMRMEFKQKNPVTGKTEKMIMIIHPDKIYMIQPGSNNAFKYNANSGNNPVKHMFESSAGRNKAKKTGSGKAGGVKCGIYEYSVKYDIGNTSFKTKIKEWRSKKDGFVMKTVSKTSPYEIMGQKVKAATSIMEMLKLKKNVKIPDSKFKVPSGIKIQDIEKMQGGYGAPESGDYNASMDKIKEQFGEITASINHIRKIIQSL